MSDSNPFGFIVEPPSGSTSAPNCLFGNAVSAPRSNVSNVRNNYGFVVQPPVLKGTSGFAANDMDFEGQFAYHRELGFSDDDPILHEVKDLPEGDHFRNQILMLCKKFRKETGMCMYVICLCI